MSVAPSSTTAPTQHKTVHVDGLEIFYREAGDRANPTLLLLHGLPTSSRMFRNLIPALADRFHLVAPDYPGFGHSAFPPANEFDYSFANLTGVVERFIEVVGLERFSIYIQDYGAPIGLSIASARPERVQAIITQSGNAYMDGFTPFWEPLFAFATDPSPENEAKVRPLLTREANVWQWTHGTRDPENIDPDLRLPAEPRQVPRVPAVLPGPPAADADHVGQERRDLRARRRPRVPQGPPRRRAAPARHRPLCARGGAGLHRRTDSRLPHAPRELSA
jgi:pimeloyl-ACP methyl ester carboxylesterase